MRLVVKTVPGLEDLLAGEVKGVGRGKELAVINRGVLFVEVDERRLLGLLDQSRYITSASLLVTYVEGVKRLEEIANAAREAEWERYVHEGARIAVRTERSGEHQFTSMDVSRVVGEAVLSRLSSRGVSSSVHLGAPDTVITVDVIRDRVFMGVRLAGEESLHRRWYRVYEHPASLNPAIASAMLELAGLRDGETLLDPVCGGGTIPIEAALFHEDIKAICNDVSPEAIRGATMNALAAGVTSRIRFVNEDLAGLPDVLRGESVDVIGADPPYGIRLGDPRRSVHVLGDLMETSRRLLRQGGRLVVIYPYRRTARDVASEKGLEVVHERMVLHGSLVAWILVMT